MAAARLSGPPGARRRPAPLDAAQTALIPLRPLSVGEILDGGFSIVQRNVSLMLGLPLLIAGGTAAYLLAGAGVWVLLGNTTSPTAQIVASVLIGLLGLLVLQQFLVWMTAVLTRISLQTVLGPGFAPASGPAGARGALHLFWPVLGLSLLQGIALSVVQTAISFGYYAVLAAVVLTSADETLMLVLQILVTLVSYVLMAAVYGYLSLAVPALAAESWRSPAWIGTPAKPTNVITAFERSVRLVGRKQLPRVIAVYSGLTFISVAVAGVAMVGLAGLLLLFARAIGMNLWALIENPWIIFAVSSASVLLAMSLVLAYAAAVQSLLYLDLRMRREGLDLAMRFDCVPIPQPSAGVR